MRAAGVCGERQYKNYRTGLIFLYIFTIFRREQASGIK
jgi:hypothetical protein